MAIPADLSGYIIQVSHQLEDFNRKGDLGAFIALKSLEYKMYDLQLISGKLEHDLRILPPSYRKRLKPFLREWIFGRYHAVLSMHRTGKFESLNNPITDPETFQAFCKMLPEGCAVQGDEHDPFPPEYAPWYHLFMYLMASFAMYVLDEPGHPIGMPFPGGSTVRRSGNKYYCPIRDKEEDIFFSICNFCPALQDPDY